MEIHKPKAAHSWREFAIEIGTITCGILIALGLEQALGALHDRQTAREGREAVYGEIRQNLSSMKERMASQACVDRRLDEIGALLVKSGDGPLSPQPKWIGQPATFFMASQRWQAATGSGRVSLLGADEQSRLAILYSITSSFDQAQAAEQTAWAQLRGLESWNGPLGPAGRVHYVSALQSARYQAWEAQLDARLAFIQAKDLGLDDIRPSAIGMGKAIPHAVRLPIDTPRDEALKRLASDANPWGQPK